MKFRITVFDKTLNQKLSGEFVANSRKEAIEEAKRFYQVSDEEIIGIERFVKAYGNLTNRIEEGLNYNADDMIHEGDDITMYYWSDRTCYYVTEVIDQKRIKVKRYHVCADHSKKGGMGHQNWLYFKTANEQNKYLNTIFKDRDLKTDYDDEKESLWVFRYNKWQNCYKDENGKLKYADLPGKISFGVRDYHYDWEF